MTSPPPTTLTLSSLCDVLALERVEDEDKGGVANPAFPLAAAWGGVEVQVVQAHVARAGSCSRLPCFLFPKSNNASIL
jgi:hypothetical protein